MYQPYGAGGSQDLTNMVVVGNHAVPIDTSTTNRTVVNASYGGGHLGTDHAAGGGGGSSGSGMASTYYTADPVPDSNNAVYAVPTDDGEVLDGSSSGNVVNLQSLAGYEGYTIETSNTDGVYATYAESVAGVADLDSYGQISSFAGEEKAKLTNIHNVADDMYDESGAGGVLASGSSLTPMSFNTDPVPGVRDRTNTFC